ncbi:hypothetical protein PtA15_1A494 [Puccinia triticina]|uniref:Uncharacterized protein n=1 Tax=Puccinia triticina TaxID=208348 RepID=A0ABY7CBA1_9BASI|nr:uncharacterized protein PtA15_1A494 [Puccinia triticina]WAQ81155.1 hypothetical protein PtA15_1A494 [Puccinia triticina]
MQKAPTGGRAPIPAPLRPRLPSALRRVPENPSAPSSPCLKASPSLSAPIGSFLPPFDHPPTLAPSVPPLLRRNADAPALRRRDAPCFRAVHRVHKDISTPAGWIGLRNICAPHMRADVQRNEQHHPHSQTVRKYPRNHAACVLEYAPG